MPFFAPDRFTVSCFVLKAFKKDCGIKEGIKGLFQILKADYSSLNMLCAWQTQAL